MDNTPFHELTPARFSSLAQSVADALSGNRNGKLAELHEQIAALLGKSFEAAPAQVRRAVREKDFASPERQAYALGQVTFAQTLVGQALTHRADDSFLDKLHSPRLRPYVEALSRRDLTNSELAEAVKENAATACRKLRELRDHGIAGFVKRGTNVVNFLTPTAQDAYTPSDALDSNVADVIQRREKTLPGHLRSSKDFGAKLGEPALV